MMSTVRAAATRGQSAAGTAGLLLAALLALLLAPHAGECVVRRLLGCACPGCGLGRALLALARLDVAGAVTSYPPLPALAALYVAGLLALVAGARGRSAQRWLRWCGACGVLSAIAVLGHWTLRLALG